MRRVLGLAAVLFLLGCASEAPKAPSGPVGSMIDAAAASNDVPRDLIAAIAAVEGGLRLPLVREVRPDDAVPVAGVLELRHGRFDSLARGVELTGRSSVDLQTDLALGTEAGARVLAALADERGIDRRDLASYASIVEEMSGHLATRDRMDYRARVFAILWKGGTFTTRTDERVVIAPNDAVPFELTIPPPPAAPLGNPEYPSAIWFDTPQANKWTPGRQGPIGMIAIHDTEGGWDASVATLQNDPGKSVHYIVDADGSRVGQFVYEADTAWHVGNWYYNSRMVGIEHVGVASNDDYQTPMYATSADLVKNIASRNGLTISRDIIIGHQEVPDGNNIPEDSPPCTDAPSVCIKSPNYGGAANHRDPGVYWEWCQYMEMLGSVCKCNDAHDLFNCVHDLSEMVRCNSGNVEIVHCPAGCIVEPNGVDDQCMADPATSSTTATGAGGAMTSTGSFATVGVTVTASVGVGAGGGVQASVNGDVKGGCACEVGSGDERSGMIALVGVAAALASRRRRRR